MTDDETEMSLLFFRRDDRMLLGETLTGPFAGYVKSHGGKRKAKDATIEACAVREGNEETGGSSGREGLTARTVNKLGEMLFSFTFKSTVHHVHIYDTRNFSGSVSDTPEMRNAWYNEKALPVERMMPGDRLWMHHVIAGQRFEGWCRYRKNEAGLFVVDAYAINSF